MKVLIWVTHLLGVGHFHRAVRIARGLVDKGFSVTIANGGFELENVRLGSFEVVQLPPLKSPDVTFKRLVGPDGNDIEPAYMDLRRDALVALARKIEPRVILTELFPFGRWKFQHELVGLFEDQRARPSPPLVVASIRDILVPPRKAIRLETIRHLVETYFDAVLVHGDPDFIRLEETLPLASRFADIIDYTGYIVPDYVETQNTDGADEVIVSAGGSAFGGSLLAAAIAARPLSTLASAPWRILAGQNLAQQTYADLQNAASKQTGVIVERVRADFPEILTRARLSVSQAGYNTTADVLAAGIGAVFAPFAEADESEQSRRVALLAGHGLAVVVEGADLTGAKLAGAVDRAVALAPQSANMPLLDGAGNTAKLIAALVAKQKQP
ncbi:MAG: glycosyltransferase family protein [Alphaproteobacteria bacterium]